MTADHKEVEGRSAKALSLVKKKLKAETRRLAKTTQTFSKDVVGGWW